MRGAIKCSGCTQASIEGTVCAVIIITIIIIKRRPQSPEGDLHEGPLNYSGECINTIRIVRNKQNTKLRNNKL